MHPVYIIHSNRKSVHVTSQWPTKQKKSVRNNLSSISSISINYFVIGITASHWIPLLFSSISWFVLFVKAGRHIQYHGCNNEVCDEINRINYTKGSKMNWWCFEKQGHITQRAANFETFTKLCSKKYTTPSKQKYYTLLFAHVLWEL